MNARSKLELTVEHTAEAVIPSPLPFGEAAQLLKFTTEPNSPWPDGYSLEGERAALADILESDVAEADPRWPRVIEFEKREAEYARKQTAYRQRRGAETVVSDREATSFRALGNLVDESADTMEVHTLEAYRLFIGRAASPDAKLYAIPGGKRQGAALRTLWLLTGNDNPYAEWALLLHEQYHRNLQELLTEEVLACAQRVNALAERGLRINLLVSKSPEKLELGFRSPYGYAICELLLDYDLFIRHIKTLERKNQLTDEKARLKIRDVTRKIRAAWLEVVRFERYLGTADLRELSRADFLPTATDAGRNRAQAARQLFGGIPSAIFEGRQTPEHSRRRGQLTPQERALLHDIGNTIRAEDEAAPGEPALQAGPRGLS